MMIDVLQTDAPDRESEHASRLRVARYSAREWTAAMVRRAWKARELEPVRVRPALRRARIVAILVVRDELPRFPYLLEHYRRAGVEHFIVIDNESTDGLHEFLADARDVSLFRAHGEFGQARYGIDWVNHVASKHCAGKWLVHVDADELLVVAGGEGNLHAVCDTLDSRGQRAVHAVMLDMYSERPASHNVVPTGTSPLAVCPLYDTTGYRGFYDPRSLTTWIKGGVRGRLFFSDIHDSPALNKTPLVRWRRHYAFAQVAHRLVPRRLNRQAPHAQAVLLHFKFTSVSHAKFTDESNLAQHTTEYTAYHEVDSVTFRGPDTAQYESVEDLVHHGIVARIT